MSLPTFTFTLRPDLAAPPMPDLAQPAVTAWRDGRGDLGAVSHRVGPERWLHVPHVASFRLDVEGRAVDAVPAEGVAPERVRDEFQRTAVPVALQLAGWEVLHASAVRTERGVVALCAASETGKSTLAHGLERRGYPLWADDAVVLRVAASATTAHALPFDLRLRPASARHFGYAVEGGAGNAARDARSEAKSAARDARDEAEVDPPGDVAPPRTRAAATADRDEAPLRAILLLERVMAEPPVSGARTALRPAGGRAPAPGALPTPHAAAFQPLEGAEALRGLLDHAIFFGLDDPVRKRRMMRNYLQLVADLGVVRLRFPSGLESLPGVLDALEERLR